MIDVHSHIIPKIDDGSSSFEESYRMIEQAEKAGFTDIIATSHYVEDYYEVDSIKRHSIVEAMNKVVHEKGLNIQIHTGSEIFVTQNIVELIKDKKATTLADSKYVLFELPRNSKINYLDNVIFEIKSNGLIPVIAHPERYSYVQSNPNFVYDLIKNGVLFQANYASITGYYGQNTKRTLKKLLKANMIHFLGSDSHNDKKYDNIEECIKVLKKIISKDKLEELTTINPRHILNDEQIKIEEPKKIKRGIF
jgi:protein-tyrosine phosphatase